MTAGSDVGSPLSLVVSQALEMVDSCNLMESTSCKIDMDSILGLIGWTDIHRGDYSRQQ